MSRNLTEGFLEHKRIALLFAILCAENSKIYKNFHASKHQENTSLECTQEPEPNEMFLMSP